MPQHTTYFWLSLTGALVLSGLFGVALPRLVYLIIREISWARPMRSSGIVVAVQLVIFGGAWGFDAYCQWFGLINDMAIMLFLCSVVAAIATALGYRYYHKLNQITTRSYLDQERKLLRTVQRVSPSGFFVSRPDGKGGWEIQSANRAACDILGFEFRTYMDNELIGTTGMHTIPPNQIEKVQRFANTSGKVNYLLQMIRKDGGLRWVEVSAETLPDYHGAAARVTCFTDVTIHMEKNRELADELRLAKLVKDLEGHVKRITSEESTH